MLFLCPSHSMFAQSLGNAFGLASSFSPLLVQEVKNVTHISALGIPWGPTSQVHMLYYLKGAF